MHPSNFLAYAAYYITHIHVFTHTPTASPWAVIPPPALRLLTSGKLPQALLSLYLRAIKPACCGAEIDVDSTAFVFSLANSKSIFLTFFYLLSSHNLPLCPPSLLLLYLCYSSVHLYSAQTWVSPIASLYLILGYFPPSLLPRLCLTSRLVPLNLLPPLHLITAPPPHLLLVPHSPPRLSAEGTHAAGNWNCMKVI